MDVYRRFNPQVTESNLDSDSVIGSTDDLEIIVASIEGVEGKWNRNARPMTPEPVGRGGWIYKSAKGAGLPLNIYLDHMWVIPFDAAQGDAIERRTGLDTWTDITSEEGSSWTANYRKGKLTLIELPGHGSLPALRRFKDRFIRVTYRVGLGGEFQVAGLTTLTEQLAQGSTTTIGVDDAQRLPPSGGTMLIDGTEYVEISSVAHDTNELTVASRGLRLTSDQAHASGVEIHYCPLDVREAVAAKAAQELVRHNDWTDQLVETGGQATPPAERKLQDWEDEWTGALANYSDNYGYQ